MTQLWVSCEWHEDKRHGLSYHAVRQDLPPLIE